MKTLTADELTDYCADLAKAGTEHAEQRAFFAWLNYMKYSQAINTAHLVFAIPNGGERGKAAAGRFKAEGVKAGVPDTLYPVPRSRYAGLFLELKKVKDGVASSKQKQWHIDLREQHYAVAICWGWRAAVDCFLAYDGGNEIEEQYK